MNNKIAIAATAVVSLAAGLASGYFIARYRFEEQLGVFADELDEMQTYFENVIAEIKAEHEEDGDREFPQNEFKSPLEAWDAKRPLGQVTDLDVAENGLTATLKADPEASELIRNIFAEGESELDDETILAEVAARNDLVPYILSADEFYSNESGYDQASLTYFEGDDVLIDERQVPVPDVVKLVGEDALGRFGWRSKDKNLVFVRNEKLKMELEIARSDGTYRKEVLGLDEPMKKSHRRKPPKE